MASNNYPRYVGSLFGDLPPLVILGKFQAGATQAIKRGEMLELSSGNWIPLDADQSMTAIIAIAAEEIKSGDLAGYYHILVPRPGDLWDFPLAADNSSGDVGDALYWSDSETLTATAGSNILAYIVGQHHYPQKQGHAADGDPADRGTTIRSVRKVQVTFKAAVSYYAALQP